MRQEKCEMIRGSKGLHEAVATKTIGRWISAKGNVGFSHTLEESFFLHWQLELKLFMAVRVWLGVAFCSLVVTQLSRIYDWKLTDGNAAIEEFQTT